MTNMTDAPTPPTPPPAGPPPGAGWGSRLLRRSSDDRIAAGVCGGLGEYFGVDPVIFRVLFAVTAFVGAGIVAYLIAWALIPERGAVNPPLDRAVAELRRRHVPVWLVVVVAAIVGWAALFSWWSPWPFVPVALATVVLVVALNRRPTAPQPAPPPGYPSDTAAYQAPPAAGVAERLSQAQATRSQVAAWVQESRAAARERRRRAAPMRWVILAVLAGTLLVLGICDAIGGIVIPAYFWAVLIVVGGGLIMGIALRRTPWTLALLLVPAAIGSFIFSGTKVSFHDGSGDNAVAPRSVAALDSEYRQAFGRTTIDLSNVGSVDASRTVVVRQAAGQLRVIVPRTLPVVVHSDVHLGSVEVDGSELQSGYNFSREVPTGPTGAADQLTLDVTVTAGQVDIERVG